MSISAIIETTEKELLATCGTKIVENKKRITNSLIDSIQENIKGIPENRIEGMIDDYFIDELKAEINKLIKAFMKRIEPVIMTRQDSPEILEQELMTEYKSINLSSFEDLPLAASRQITNRIANYFECFRGFVGGRIDDALYNIRNDIKSRINFFMYNLLEEIVREVGKAMKKIPNKMDNKEEVQEQTNSSIADMFDHPERYSPPPSKSPFDDIGSAFYHPKGR